MDPSDADLARAARGGRREAFDALVERHGRTVLAYLIRVLGSRDDAMDSFQDTFLRAFRALPMLRDPHRFRPWLVQIAVNCARRCLERRRRAPGTADLPDGLDPVDPDQGGLPPAAHFGGAVRDALARLPPRQREVLSLRLDGGLSYREIGELLSIREENARANHYQALKSLRRTLHHLQPGAPQTRNR